MLRPVSCVVALTLAVGYASQADAGGSLKDDVVAAPVFAPVVSWTGCYLGAHAGYAWGRDKWRIHDDPTALNHVDQPFDIDVDGGIVGGQVGCNYQMNQLVVGGEASISLGNVNGKGPKGIGTTFTRLIPGTSVDTETLTGLYDTKAEFDNIFRAVVRVGYAVDQWHFYLKGGYAGADVKKCVRGEITTVNNRTNAVTRTPNSFCDERWHNGYTFGLGSEFMATANIILGIDYSFVDLGKVGHRGFDPSGDFYDIWNDGEVHKLTARVSYKFGVAPVPIQPLK